MNVSHRESWHLNRQAMFQNEICTSWRLRDDMIAGTTRNELFTPIATAPPE